MAAPTFAPARPARRDFVERFWQIASSPKLGSALLAAIAAASVAGAWLELRDLFRSWWFTLVLVAAALHVVAAAIERLPGIVRDLARPEARLTDEVARGTRRVERLQAENGAEAEAARVAAAFRSLGYRPRIMKDRATTYVFAERGRPSLVGACVVPVALLAMLGGGLANALAGIEGTIDVHTGGIFDSFSIRAASGETYRKALPFLARVNAFDIAFDGSGRPGLVRSDVSLFDRTGRLLARQEVDGAHPLREAGFAIHQAGYREDESADRAAIVLVDKVSGARQEVALASGEDAEAGGVRFSVRAYVPSFGAAGPAVRIRRAESGRETEFWVFERRPTFDAENRTDRYAVEFHGLRKGYAPSLRIAREPGTPWLLVGAAVLVAALIVAFAPVHRQLWARIEPGAILLAGSTRRGAAAFDRAFDALKANLASRGAAA